MTVMEPKPKKGAKVGEIAEPFEILDTTGKTFNSTTTLKNSNGLILEFYRGAEWDPCNEQLHKTFQDHLTELEKRNIKIIALAPDKPEDLKTVAMREKYTFPIIPDLKGKIAKKFKVYDYRSIFILGTKMAIPSTFILDKNGKIIWKFVGTKYIRASFDMIISAIDKNQNL